MGPAESPSPQQAESTEGGAELPKMVGAEHSGGKPSLLQKSNDKESPLKTVL